MNKREPNEWKNCAGPERDFDDIVWTVTIYFLAIVGGLTLLTLIISMWRSL